MTDRGKETPQRYEIPAAVYRAIIPGTPLLTPEEILRQRSKELDLNQAELAQIMGISQSYLNRILNGKRAFPEADIFRTARALGMTGEDVLQMILPGHVQRAFKDVDLAPTENKALTDTLRLTHLARFGLALSGAALAAAQYEAGNIEDLKDV